MAECRTNSPTNFCKTYPDTRCIVYTGPNLACTEVHTNDRLEEILQKIDSKICSAGGIGTVTSVGATITSGAINIAGSPITTSGTFAFTYTGTTSQYIRGDGSLAAFSAATAYIVHTIDNTDSPYTVSETSGVVIILIDASMGSVTVNLPTAIGNVAEYRFKRIDNSGNTIIIDANGIQTIDGDLTKEILFQYTAFTIISNNANWFRTS